MQVIPAINCHLGDTQCAEDALAKARKFLKKGDWVHLDIADGKFTFNKTWGSPTEWARLRSEFNLEVHLMVEEPEKHIKPWFAAEAKRFIIHAETLTEGTARSIVDRVARKKLAVMLSSNPHTATTELWPLLKFFSDFQVLAVSPGLAGQKFLPSVLPKIKFLRNFAPNANIEVDGGVNLETGKLAASAGGDILVAASYIFGSKNPKKAYESLKKL